MSVQTTSATSISEEVLSQLKLLTSRFDDSSTDVAMSQETLAEQLGCSVRTLSRMRTEGTGPAYVRVHGQRIAYRRSEVEDWLRRNERVRTDEDGR